MEVIQAYRIAGNLITLNVLEVHSPIKDFSNEICVCTTRWAWFSASHSSPSNSWGSNCSRWCRPGSFADLTPSTDIVKQNEVNVDLYKAYRYSYKCKKTAVRHPQNRTYITHRNAFREGPSHGHRQHVQTFGGVRPCGFRVMRSDRQTNR